MHARCIMVLLKGYHQSFSYWMLKTLQSVRLVQTNINSEWPYRAVLVDQAAQQCQLQRSQSTLMKKINDSEYLQFQNYATILFYRC